MLQCLASTRLCWRWQGRSWGRACSVSTSCLHLKASGCWGQRSVGKPEVRSLCAPRHSPRWVGPGMGRLGLLLPGQTLPNVPRMAPGADISRRRLCRAGWLLLDFLPCHRLPVLLCGHVPYSRAHREAWVQDSVTTHLLWSPRQPQRMPLWSHHANPEL